MLRRRQDHVLEPTENVWTNGFAFVAACQGGHEYLGRNRYAQVIRPEGDQPLHERSLAYQSRLECGTAFCRRDLDQSSSRLLARLRWLCLLGRLGRRRLSSVRLRGHAERANRIADRGRGRYGRSGRHRWVAGELRPEPAARVTQSAPLARARTQPEAVQRSECSVHVRGYSPLGLNVYQRHGTVGFDARATQNGPVAIGGRF